MKRYNIYYTFVDWSVVTVEASSKEEALDVFYTDYDNTLTVTEVVEDE